MGSRSRPTISETNVWRAGLSNRFTTPSSPARRNTVPGRTVGTTSRPRASASSPAERLGGVQDLALVESVGNQPAEGPEKEHRQELEPDGHGHVDAGAVEEEENQVGLGHRLHPGTRDRDDLPGEVQPVVPHRQGGERRRRPSPMRLTARPDARRGPPARPHAACSLGVQLCQPAGQEGVLQRADALESAPPVGGDAHPGAAPVGRCRSTRVTMPASARGRQAASWSAVAPARRRPARPASACPAA